MRYLRKQAINRRAPYDQRLQIDVNNSILMSSPSGVQVPSGTVNQRPIVGNRYGVDNAGDLSGMIRYNADTSEFEGNQAGEWRAFRFKEATQITVQDIGVGDFVETTFGPLNPAPPTLVQSGAAWTGANILVIVENVIQIFGTNYTITQAPANGKPGTGYWVAFDSAVPTDKHVTVLHGFDK